MNLGLQGPIELKQPSFIVYFSQLKKVLKMMDSSSGSVGTAEWKSKMNIQIHNISVVEEEYKISNKSSNRVIN